MKTARMTILLDPAEKASIETRARAHSMSTGEYVRRASASYEAEIDEATLEAIVDTFAENVSAMRQSLQRTAAHVESCLAEMEALRATVHGPR
jgi:hypothetical protein